MPPPATLTARAASTAPDRRAAAGPLDQYVTWVREQAGFDPLVVQPAIGQELAPDHSSDLVIPGLVLMRRRPDHR